MPRRSSPQRKQIAAQRTIIDLVRYVLDHPGVTTRNIAADLGMSFPNASRLVAELREKTILVSQRQRPTGKRGPWSHVLSLRGEAGCCLGVDIEATHVRGVILDYANTVIGLLRQPITPAMGPDALVHTAAFVAATLHATAEQQGVRVHAIGLGLPGPVVDAGTGRVRTTLQFGEAELEFLPSVQAACPNIHAVATTNSYCFALGHYRLSYPPRHQFEVVILDRFGISATPIMHGNVYTGSAYRAGDIGLLSCPTVQPPRPYQDVCTGSALLQLARARQDSRSILELLQVPTDPIVQEWLQDAIPAFAEAIFTTIVVLNPEHILVEGIFDHLSGEVQQRITDAVAQRLAEAHHPVPEITFFQGDDLMGAIGASCFARDTVSSEAIYQQSMAPM
jgi:predicted NBD/HSP70 family sugar kinase